MKWLRCWLLGHDPQGRWVRSYLNRLYSFRRELIQAPCQRCGTTVYGLRYGDLVKFEPRRPLWPLGTPRARR